MAVTRTSKYLRDSNGTGYIFPRALTSDLIYCSDGASDIDLDNAPKGADAIVESLKGKSLTGLTGLSLSTVKNGSTISVDAPDSYKNIIIKTSDGAVKLGKDVTIDGSETVGDLLTAKRAVIGTAPKVVSISSGEVVIAATTASSSTGTGALRVAGGTGIAGSLNVGGNTKITSTTASSSKNYKTGAMVVAGGAAIAKSLEVGWNIRAIETNNSDDVGYIDATHLRSYKRMKVLEGGADITGDTMINGQLGLNRGSTSSDAYWVNARDYANIVDKRIPSAGGWYPSIDIKSTVGDYSLGALGEDFYLSYVTNEDYEYDLNKHINVLQHTPSTNTLSTASNLSVGGELQLNNTNSKIVSLNYLGTLLKGKDLRYRKSSTFPYKGYYIPLFTTIKDTDRSMGCGEVHVRIGVESSGGGYYYHDVLDFTISWNFDDEPTIIVNNYNYYYNKLINCIGFVQNKTVYKDVESMCYLCINSSANTGTTCSYVGGFAEIITGNENSVIFDKISEPRLTSDNIDQRFPSSSYKRTEVSDLERGMNITGDLRVGGVFSGIPLIKCFELPTSTFNFVGSGDYSRTYTLDMKEEGYPQAITIFSQKNKGGDHWGYFKIKNLPSSTNFMPIHFSIRCNSWGVNEMHVKIFTIDDNGIEHEVLHVSNNGSDRRTHSFYLFLNKSGKFARAEDYG